MANGDDLIARARAFFDRKGGKLAGDVDPELQVLLKRLESQVKTVRDDKSFKTSLIRTLAVIERDVKARRQNVEDKVVADAQSRGKKLSAEELAAAVTRGIPRELRYIQASGLSLVQALNSNSKMSEKELRKFNDRLASFTTKIEDLKSDSGKGARAYAQESNGGLTLTERLRQYKDGQLLDDKRHKELLEHLDEASDRASKDAEKSGDLRKLGLTALFGPAAPLFQLWYDAKEDIAKLKDDGKELLEKTKAKFKWDTEKDKDDKVAERRRTGVFERMLKALKEKARGKKGRGLLGWLFGGDDEEDDDVSDSRRRRSWRSRAGRGLRRIGRTLGRTARGLGGLAKRGIGLAGRGLGALGRGTAVAARMALPAAGNLASSALSAGGSLLGGAARLGATSLGGLAAGGAGALAGGAAMLAGAGYAGYKAGQYINDNLLTAEQKELIGNAIGKTVDFVSELGPNLKTAFSAATIKLTSFYDSSVERVGEAYTMAKKDLIAKSREVYESAADRLGKASEVVQSWTDDAKDNLKNFWNVFKGGALAVGAAAVAAARTTQRNAQDFVAPQAGGDKVPVAEKSVGERARARLDAAVDTGKGFFGGGSRGVRDALEQQMTAQGITDPRERAMMLSQMSHESGGFRSMEESFNYRSADRVASVSATARRAGTDAINAAMAKGPEALAELMYGGRMGNTEAGDGHKFRGRGPIQLTGRDNYKRYGDKLGIDLLSNPDLAKDPEVAARIAVEYWKDRKLGAEARAGNVEAVTKGINGGYNGLEERTKLYNQYLREQTAAGGTGTQLAANTAGISSAGGGRATALGAATDPRRLDRPSSVNIATPAAAGRTATTQALGGSSYERVTTKPTQVIVEQQAPATDATPTTTASTNKVGLDGMDFYVSDLGLIIANRGLNG